MTVFHNISQAVTFTANEIALFHALSYSWNAARRPAVIEQWAEVTARNSGMERHAMARARNKLVQAGVIHFDKPGNRSTPRYSFNALFELPSPFLRAINGTEISATCTLTARKSHVNRSSKQEEGKEKGESKDAPAPERVKNQFADTMPTAAAEDMQSIADRINGLAPPWKQRPALSYQEMSDLSANAKVFSDMQPRDWKMLESYLDAIIPDSLGKFWQPVKRSMFIRTIADVLTDADRWARITKWKEAA